MRYAAAFHVPPQTVEENTAVLWWERWLLWEQAQRSAEANRNRDAYPHDKDGNPKWAEWAKKNPELSRMANWALTDE